MVTGTNGTERALFKKITDDGRQWLFVILPDDRWAITCDGEQTAAGESNAAGLRCGVQQFLSIEAGEQVQLEVATV